METPFNETAVKVREIPISENSRVLRARRVQETHSSKRDVLWKLWNAMRYVLPYPRKVFNYIGIRSSLMMGNPMHRFYPVKLGVEVTNRCNLKCPLCLRSSNPNRMSGDMKWENYVNLIDSFSPFLFQVRLHGNGEPTLHPSLPEMVKYAHQKGIYTNFHTNGNLLTKRLINALIDSKLDEVNIALDGISEETYSQYRVGGSCKRVMDGVTMFCNVKKEHNSRTPRINLQFLIMGHNEHEIPQVKAFAAETGVNRLYLKPVNIHYGIESGNQNYLPSNKAFSRYGSMGMMPKNKKKQHCTRGATEIIVNWDGSLSLCGCDDPQASKIKGNIFTEGSRKVLFSQQCFEAKQQSFNMNYEMCNHCIDAQSPI